MFIKKLQPASSVSTPCPQYFDHMSIVSLYSVPEQGALQDDTHLLKVLGSPILTHAGKGRASCLPHIQNEVGWMWCQSKGNIFIPIPNRAPWSCTNEISGTTLSPREGQLGFGGGGFGFNLCQQGNSHPPPQTSPPLTHLPHVQFHLPSSPHCPHLPGAGLGISAGRTDVCLPPHLLSHR